MEKTEPWKNKTIVEILSAPSRCIWTMTLRNIAIITFTVLISRSQDVSLGHLNKYNILICDLVLLDQFVPASQAFLISAVIFRNNETQK